MRPGDSCPASYLCCGIRRRGSRHQRPAPAQTPAHRSTRSESGELSEFACVLSLNSGEVLSSEPFHAQVTERVYPCMRTRALAPAFLMALLALPALLAQPRPRFEAAS